MTDVGVDGEGRFIGLPDPGAPGLCPRAAYATACGNHTPLRFTWPAGTVHQMGSGEGPRVLIVAKNPSCPDLPTNSTLGPILSRSRLLGAGAVAVVNVLPVRKTDARDIRAADFDRQVLEANRDVLKGLVGWADIVIAAWGRTPPDERAARPFLDREVRWFRSLLASHDDVRQIGNEYQPSAWNRWPHLVLQRWQAPASAGR